MTTETQAQREARWSESRARQEAYAASPEAKVARAERIAAGLCVGRDWCVTHDVAMDLGHDLAINGTTWPDGTARDD